MAIQFALIVGLWVGFYTVNGWMFDQLAFSAHVSWIFLPAALRMIAVLLVGWLGTVAIFVGSLITCVYVAGLTDNSQILIVSGLSALAPTLALLVCAHFFGVRANLAGLSAKKLLLLSVLAASFTTALHNVHFATAGYVDALGDSVAAMFVGDLVGTLIVLYGAKCLLMTLLPRQTNRVT